MIYKLKIIFLALVFGLVVLAFACDDKSQLKNQSTSHTVSGKISQPINKNKIKKAVKNSESNPTKKLKSTKNSSAGTKIKTEDQLSGQKPEQKTEQKSVKKESEHYNFKGKIDPFIPLIQEKLPKTQPVVDKRPERILTPLEKIELSQIRLVAVIIMENRQIAMVEEASGKGYEVGIGTYIGKNQGRVSEIRESSIVVKELVRDFKGRLKERIKEIKLHKIDGEG